MAELKNVMTGINYTIVNAKGTALSKDDNVGTGTVITAENGNVITIIIKGKTEKTPPKRRKCSFRGVYLHNFH